MLSIYCFLIQSDYLNELTAGRVKPYFIKAYCKRKYCDLNRPRNEAFETDEAAPYYDFYHGKIVFQLYVQPTSSTRSQLS